jgi:hypothetical protein
VSGNKEQLKALPLVVKDRHFHVEDQQTADGSIEWVRYLRLSVIAKTRCAVIDRRSAVARLRSARASKSCRYELSISTIPAFFGFSARAAY